MLGQTDPADREALVAAWRTYCATLQHLGESAIDASPDDAPNLLDGLRYVTRLAGIGLDYSLEHAPWTRPELFAHMGPHRKYGLDSPDNAYLMARLDGGAEYRLSGVAGNADYIGFGVHAGVYGGTTRVIAHRNGDQLGIVPGQAFAVTVSPSDPGGPWVPSDADATSLLVRQTFLDRANAAPARMNLERIRQTGREPLSLERLDGALAGALGFAGGCLATFVAQADRWREAPNTLHRFGDRDSASLHGDPDIDYFPGAWRLGAGEALIVDIPVVDAPYWGFQLCNYWMESLERTEEPPSLNCAEVVRNPDGSVRIVVAHADPGSPNFVSTQGYGEGTMMLRYVNASSAPPPTTAVVPLSELASAGSPAADRSEATGHGNGHERGAT